MAIYVAENGVGLSDIFTALQAGVTFSRKPNSYKEKEEWEGGDGEGESEEWLHSWKLSSGEGMAQMNKENHALMTGWQSWT